MPNYRSDHQGEHRTAYEKNRKKLLATQDTCALCGRPIDKSLRYPHPLSPCVDHIIPIVRGGHPSDISNLQLVHFTCNRAKADKLPKEIKDSNKDLSSLTKQNQKEFDDSIVSNRVLPLCLDWKNF